MLSLLGFIIILGPLVIVHELGHYFFARIFGVKAEIFSVGFGPRLWKKQLGETELRISAIPLGGYVKLMGEDRESELSPEDMKRALHKQVPWKRFFIFFGGPLFNFLLAIVVFMAIFAIGEPKVASVVGRVVQGSAAERAGFEAGDRIVSVEGNLVKSFEEVAVVISENPGKQLRFEVKRKDSGQAQTVLATPERSQGFSLYGEATHVGDIDGLSPAPRAATLGISNLESPAGQAGLRTGDRITAINGMPIANWEELERFYRNAAPGSELRLAIEPTESSDSERVKEALLRKPESGAEMAQAWGLHSSELFVEKTMPDSPAEAGGVRRGDRLIGVGPVKVQSFLDLRSAIQKSGEKEGKVLLKWEREGREFSELLKPTATEVRDPIMNKAMQYTIGVAPMLEIGAPETYVERIWNPAVLLYKATERMVTFVWRNFVAIQKMFTGDVSVNTLGGPIMIGKIAGESLTRGLTAFLATMAILSIGLGVLNILPVPVLDGGHLLLLGLEMIRGKPLTIKTMEVIQLVGLSLILLLMAVVLKNDFARLTYF
ncbi:MAG: RIP metalloprotease RseP [Bdellovibrionales bacterium GWB1_55_8]|nr:MAG: RIP metalloprotease RseP [Bdellovibrionales bacterium GWB1_55_8]